MPTPALVQPLKRVLTKPSRTLKAWLMPTISRRLLSEQRLHARRVKAELKRQRDDKPHVLIYFHQADDPYSALMAQVLPRLLTEFDVRLQAHIVPPPPADAAPDRQRLIAYSRRDAALLAKAWSAQPGFPPVSFTDPNQQPHPDLVIDAQFDLLAAIEQGRFVESAGKLSRRLWERTPVIEPPPTDLIKLKPVSSSPKTLIGMPKTLMGMPKASPPEPEPMPEPTPEIDTGDDVLDAHLRESDAKRRSLGHYLGGTLYYEGEWYWGLDRLHHLQRRLEELGARREPSGGRHGQTVTPNQPRPAADDAAPETLLWMMPATPTEETPTQILLRTRHAPPPIEFFLSLRSPYTAIVAQRLFALADRYGADVKLRFVLPMVMRGLPVPKIKRQYIAMDAAREARVHGVPFGCINDPVGRPTERGLCLIPLAERSGLGREYVLSFLRGVWAEGIDAGSDKGLRLIAERVGLRRNEISLELARIDAPDGWRKIAEQNRQDMLALGLWGVPSFNVGEVSVWGQDRLWAVAQELERQSRL